MAERPGFMIYFTDWLPLLKLDDSTLATLFRACVKYAGAGEWPELAGTSEIIWGMLYPKLDRDGERYESRKESGEYAAFCREEKRAGREPVSFAAWRIEKDRSITTDIDRYRSDIDSIQLQPQLQPQLQLQPQPQSHIHSHLHPQQQAQGEKQGDTRGAEGGSLPGAFSRMNVEQEFETKREAALRRLENQPRF